MNLAKYLRQTVRVERVKPGRNFDAETSYDPPVDIKARKEEKQNRVRNSQGMELLSTASVLTIQELKLGDLVDGWAVQARENIVDKSGRILGWRSYL